MARNQKIRFMDNNMLAASTTALTVSGSTSGFPFSNVYNSNRYETWKGPGTFTIDATNNKVYVNDGSDKTATVTPGDYTAAGLATEITTQLNSVSTGWTVSYSSTNLIFTFSATGTKTVKLSSTTNAIWDTLGFVSSLDIAEPVDAEEQRVMTGEYVEIDLGTAQEVTFFSMLPTHGEIFSVSNQATVTLKADNIPSNWASPALSRTLTVTDQGIMEFLDDVDNTFFRYWRLDIQDRLNPLGTESVVVGHMYLGDYRTLTTSNTQIGFVKNIDDQADVVYSEYGVPFFNTRSKILEFSNLSIPYISADERRLLEQMVYSIGLSSPFYLSLDPTLQCSADLFEMTRLVRFSSMPSFTHVIRDLYTMNLQVMEVI